MAWRAFDEGGFNALITFIQEIQNRAESKQDKTRAVEVTISATNWNQDETEGYPHYCDLPAEGVTAKDRAEVTIFPAGLAAASACGLCPTNETLAGKVRIRAARVPDKDILAELWIEKGEE